MDQDKLPETGPETGPEPAPQAAGALSRLSGLVSNIVLLLLATLVVGLFGGYILFLSEIASMSRPQNPKADAIIVLTGGYQRISEAADLLEIGAGKRLLISGVNRTTTLAQIRRCTGSSKVLFDCCVDVGYDALDTTGNAAEAVAWIRAHDYHSVIVVTNDYHIPRTMLELRRIDKQTDYMSWPVETSPLSVSILIDHPYLVVTLTSEYLKILYAAARDLLPFDLP